MFGVVKEASRISHHEWHQSIGVIWNKHWTTFGATLMDPSFCSRVRNSRSFRNTTMNPLENGFIIAMNEALKKEAEAKATEKLV
jgi:hypothetical protein